MILSQINGVHLLKCDSKPCFQGLTFQGYHFSTVYLCVNGFVCVTKSAWPSAVASMPLNLHLQGFMM